MQHPISVAMGLDVGDRKTHFCALDEDTSEILGEGAVGTTRKGRSVAKGP